MDERKSTRSGADAGINAIHHALIVAILIMVTWAIALAIS
jgi:hypothetical protein